MSKQVFFQSLLDEIARVDAAHVTKRRERYIERFTDEASPKAVIGGKEYRVFNSNDYLGLRHHPALKQAEHEMTQKCGTGPGAVRFISGSFEVHAKLEQALARFHGQEAGMVFSSAFAANLATLFSLIKPQSKDSVISGNTLVISDELNHRSIIDGIRLANLSADQKQIFKHLDASSLESVLSENVGRFDRALVVTDGVFSMLGEYQDLQALTQVIEKYDAQYAQGVLLIVDDCHGVAAFGKNGRGTQEMSGASYDILVGTLGKGLGTDGGYVVGSKVIIDYLRESAATYIYSNSIAPGTAAAALAAVELLDTEAGKVLLGQLAENVVYLKSRLTEIGFTFAAESVHPIQPVLIGDTAKTKELTAQLFELGFMVTNINYPVVPKGRDEIRVQLCATHTREDLDLFISAMQTVGASLGII